MFNPFRSPIRIMGVARKEVISIVRQKRLLLTLILGPFFILLLFGIGYREKGPPLRTMFVLSPDDPLRKELEKYAPAFSSQLKFEGIANNLAEAKIKLQRREIDLIVEAPSNAIQTIRNNKQAIFTLYHDEIDPYRADYIGYTGELYVDKLNHALLNRYLETGKSRAADYQDHSKKLLASYRAMRVAKQNADTATAELHVQELRRELNELERNIAPLINAFDSEDAAQAINMQNQIASIKQTLEKGIGTEPGSPVTEDETENLSRMEKDLITLENAIRELQRLNPQVVFSPFRSRTNTISGNEPDLTVYFTPSVLILLLQHLAVTLSSLSIVREFRTGSMELFKVSPISNGELLIGKYAGYFLVGAMIAIALTALTVYVLKVPAPEDWYAYAGVIVIVILVSLGMGFTLSVLSETESQAIQYAMIVLLLSIFFSGFLLNLALLREPVRIVSLALPATYGIQLLQDIQLRGLTPSLQPTLYLAGAALGLFILSSLLLRRRLARI